MGDKDKAFRNFLGDKVLFLKFIRRFLSFDFIRNIGLENIALESTSFVSPDLSRRESDVLYRISIENRELYIYLLVEHQSSVDHLMPYRLLSYMVRIWDKYIENAGKSSEKKRFMLPPILPVVFYDGAGKWTAARKFGEKVANASAFSGYLPEFGYHLIELGSVSPEELLSFKDALGGLLYLASPVKKEDFLTVVKRISGYRKVIPEEEKRLLESHFTGYLSILAGKAGIDAENFNRIYREQEEESDMVTYVEKEIRRLKKEGWESGLAEGIAQGEARGEARGEAKGKVEGKTEARLSLARKLILRGFGDNEAAELTELSLEDIARLRKETTEQM